MRNALRSNAKTATYARTPSEGLPESIQKIVMPRLIGGGIFVCKNDEKIKELRTLLNCMITRNRQNDDGPSPTYYTLMASEAAEISDEILNKAFVFAGYEGRTREALYDLAIVATHDIDNDIRNDAYRALANFNFPVTLSFLLDRAFQENEGIFGIGIAIGKICKKRSEKKKKVVDRLKPLLSNSIAKVRSEIARLFITLKTRDSLRTVCEMLAVERDRDVMRARFYSFGQVSLFRFGEEFSKVLAEIIKQQINIGSIETETIFLRLIPSLAKIEEFLGYGSVLLFGL